MEKIQENTCKQVCSYVFGQENYTKVHVCLFFFHLVYVYFYPHYIIMVESIGIDSSLNSW